VWHVAAEEQIIQILEELWDKLEREKNNMAVKKAQTVMEGPSDIWLQREASLGYKSETDNEICSFFPKTTTETAFWPVIERKHLRYSEIKFVNGNFFHCTKRCYCASPAYC